MTEFFNALIEGNSALVLTKLVNFTTAVAVISIIWAIARYVVRSISLYTVAKRRGVTSYGLAWVPVAWVWALGGIADKHDETSSYNHKWRFVLVGLAAASFVLFGAYYAYTIFGFSIPAASMMGNAVSADAVNPGELMTRAMTLYAFIFPIALVSGAQGVCRYICDYKLFESCRPSRTVLLLLLDVIVPFAAPFCLLACRNYDNGLKAVPCPVETASLPEVTAEPVAENVSEMNASETTDTESDS